MAGYISDQFYGGTVKPEKILLKAKYKSSQGSAQVVTNEGKDGKPLNLGDLVM